MQWTAPSKDARDRSTLRRSEDKVADLVLADPARILEFSLAGVAALAGVSQPTVIRFCVARYSGFQELRGSGSPRAWR